MHKVWRGVAVAAAAFALVATHAQAATTLIPGKISIVKVGKLAKLVSKPTVAPPFPASPSGGSVQFFDTGGSGGSDTFPLNAGTWTGLGNPAGSKGWKYKGTKTPADPCVVVLIKETVIKAICKGASVTSGGTDFTGDIGVILNADGETYCAQIPPTTKNDGGTIIKGKDAPPPGSCPTVGPSCCPAQRISLISSAGTLQVDNLPPFPFPVGVSTVMDVATSAGGLPNCQHNVVIPAGGFSVPNFDIPALNYCSSVATLGCETGPGEGAGQLWDGNGAPNVSLTNISKVGDTSDGVCNPAGQPCVTTAGGAGANTLGDIDATKTASTTAGINTGVRSALDIRVHSLTWSDSLCSPAITPGCCPGSNYNPADGDLPITEFDFILSPTTGISTGAFVDKNADLCARAGSGFDNPGPDGPKSLTGIPAAGPCCVVGQATTVVSVGIGFSGGAPLFDLGFKSTTPNTVASCGSVGSDTCVVTTDPCLN